MFCMDPPQGLPYYLQTCLYMKLPLDLQNPFFTCVYVDTILGLIEPLHTTLYSTSIGSPGPTKYVSVSTLHDSS
jgi:hypothetical protein